MRWNSRGRYITHLQLLNSSYNPAETGKIKRRFICRDSAQMYCSGACIRWEVQASSESRDGVVNKRVVKAIGKQKRSAIIKCAA